MGTIRYERGLDRHEGYLAQVFEDGSVHGGGKVAEVDERTVAWRAACECGWKGALEVPRPAGASAWAEWEAFPELDAEWDRHIARYRKGVAP